MAPDTIETTAAAGPLAGLHPIFADCLDPDCDGKATKYRLDTPFRVGDRVYATDGRIAVRVAAPEGWDHSPGDGLRPNVEGVVGWAAGLHEPDPTALPDLPSERVRCDDCRGSGSATCEYDYDHECPVCDGTGEVPNFGEAVVLRESPRVRTSAAFAHLLKRHGATIYLPLPGSGAQAIRFTVGDAIEGLLQPLREDD